MFFYGFFFELRQKKQQYWQGRLNSIYNKCEDYDDGYVLCYAMHHTEHFRAPSKY